MEIFTLVGKSGTGKSFHAVSLAEEKNIESIIDDGLFIHKGIVLAGISAKKSETQMGAIKIALFDNDDIRDKVASEIKRKKPSSILILGTSDKMVNKIVLRLGLLEEDELDKIHRVYIEDITSIEERERARIERDKFGKHVVPAPEVQLKKNFAGYFMDPLKIIRGRKLKANSERTVVRPLYSYNGTYTIEENVIDDIVELVSLEIEGISSVMHIGHISKPDSYVLDVSVKTKYGYDVMELSNELQIKVKDTIEYMTAFNVKEVDINVRSIE